MNKMIMANILSATLLLSWIGVSLSAEQAVERYIPAGGLKAWSHCKDEYKAINGYLLVLACTENNLEASLCGSFAQGTFYLELPDRSRIPIKNLSRGAVESKQFFLPTGPSKLFATSNKGKEYTITSNKIDFTGIKPRKIAVLNKSTVDAGGLEIPRGWIHAMHHNATMHIANQDSGLFDTIEYSKRYHRFQLPDDERAAVIWFSPATHVIGKDCSEKIKRFTDKNEPFFITITSEYKNKVTVFEITKVKSAPCIDKYNRD
jgi:hypothetical protein